MKNLLLSEQLVIDYAVPIEFIHTGNAQSGNVQI
jgi:hypothetical protein